jgi:hypothetical protein
LSSVLRFFEGRQETTHLLESTRMSGLPPISQSFRVDTNSYFPPEAASKQDRRQARFQEFLKSKKEQKSAGITVQTPVRKAPTKSAASVSSAPSKSKSSAKK